MYTAEKYLYGASLDTNLEFIKREELLYFLRDIIWKLYTEHENDPIIKLRKWGFSVTIRVKHIRPLIVKWFGEL